MTKQYIYAEPDEVTGYADTDGHVHATRDEAITANVKRDLRAALAEFMDDESERETVCIALEMLARRYPGLLDAYAENS